MKETIIIGGKSVVTDNVKSQLSEPIRLSGKDRYETNVAVSMYFGLNSKHLYVATGQNYADALTGAVLAAKQNSTILLVHHNIPKSVANYLSKYEVNRLSIFGGEGAVSKDIKGCITEAATIIECEVIYHKLT